MSEKYQDVDLLQSEVNKDPKLEGCLKKSCIKPMEDVHSDYLAESSKSLIPSKNVETKSTLNNFQIESIIKCKIKLKELSLQ